MYIPIVWAAMLSAMTELPVDTLLSVDQAIAILDAAPVTPRVVRLPLMETMGMRLAEDVLADRDYPPFDKAVMDGFAVRSVDASHPGVELKVVGTIAAGRAGCEIIRAGESAAIMTGAPLPAGADAVIPVERVSRGDGKITLHAVVGKGQAMARRGSDCASHKLLLSRGTLMGPAQLGVAGTVGMVSLAVFDAPSVAVLSTGDELIDIDQVPTGGQIRNSNSVMMLALLRQLGCRVRNLGIAADDPQRIRHCIEDGLRADALFITGGMSMGEHDYVPRILRELGLKLEISKLRIKPGKPFAFARDGGGRMAFGLPGNPVSAFVCTVRLAARVFARMSGGSPDMLTIQGILDGSLPANGPRELYLPARRKGQCVTPLIPNGSADLFTLATANCLILRREGESALASGAAITTIDIPGS